MDEHEWLAERFEENRAHLRAVAYRMLGSLFRSTRSRRSWDALQPRRGSSPAAGVAECGDADRRHQREIVDAFLAASRDGEFDALVALLAPDVVLRADAVAVSSARERQGKGAPTLAPEVLGAAAVAGAFSGRARFAQRATVNGTPGAVWVQGGQTRSVFAFTITGGKIVEIEILMDPARLDQLDVVILSG